MRIVRNVHTSFHLDEEDYKILVEACDTEEQAEALMQEWLDDYDEPYFQYYLEDAIEEFNRRKQEEK